MNASLRIAVADDESFMCDYLRDTFTLLGHDVVAVAENGQDLVERCAATHPDLAVIDVNMPERMASRRLPRSTQSIRSPLFSSPPTTVQSFSSVPAIVMSLHT